MKIKFLVTIALIMLIAYSSNAQNKTTFGIRAGVNFQNLNGKDFEDDNLDYKIKTGFNVGFNAEIPVAKDYYIQPGVLFSTKGATFNDDDGSINISYIEIPLNFVFKPALGKDRLLLGFGPYAAFGIGGKVKRDGQSDSDIKFKNKITTGEYVSGTPYFKSMDAGANFLAGFQFSNKLSFQINAQLGLVKINPKVENFDDDNTTVKNTGFGVSLGYRF